MHGATSLNITGRAIKIVRKGRKRKFGVARHKCGQPIDHKYCPIKIAQVHPDRQAIPKELRHDAKAEDVIGRLNLGGRITDEEYEAGKWYAGVVKRYTQSIGAPTPQPGSIAGATTGGGGQAYIDSDEAKRRKDAYDPAFEALDRRGQRFAKAVARTAVYNEAPTNETFPYLKEGLHTLAVHRGLTRLRKSVLIT